jgi:hypothetical protein
MKPIKMFGLAALAALLAMAFVGASSAMAGSTSLCKADENEKKPCAGKNTVLHVHETSVGKAVLLSEETVECDALFLGDTFIWWTEKEDGKIKYLVGVAIELGNPLPIVGKFTYSNCTGSCTVKEENGPTVLEVLRTSDELAKVTTDNLFEGLVHLTCTIFKIDCYYVGGGLQGHALGPLTSSNLNGEVTFPEQIVQPDPNSSNTFCPVEVILDITTTPLSKTYTST